MRIRRKKQPGMPPAMVEALGRLTPAEFDLINKNSCVPPVKVEAVDSAAARAVTGRPGGTGCALAQKTPLLKRGEIQKAIVGGNPCKCGFPVVFCVCNCGPLWVQCINNAQRVLV